jgi:hypothetical protein
VRTSVWTYNMIHRYKASISNTAQMGFIVIY